MKVTKNTEKQTTNFVKVTESEVKNVRAIDTKRGTMVLFTLVLNGITIYNCKVATGKNGDFISFPQYEDKNGKYWSHVYAPLSSEDSDAILTAVQEALNG